jgi:hypothetical protein
MADLDKCSLRKPIYDCHIRHNRLGSLVFRVPLLQLWKKVRLLYQGRADARHFGTQPPHSPLDRNLLHLSVSFTIRVDNHLSVLLRGSLVTRLSTVDNLYPLHRNRSAAVVFFSNAGCRSCEDKKSDRLKRQQ